MKRFLPLLGVAAAAGAFLAPAVATAPSALATSSFKIENSTAGGCLKDQGLGNRYTVSACSIASNFTKINQNGALWEWKDGSGNCITLSAGSDNFYKAGNCVPNVTTQEMVGPSPTVNAYWDNVNRQGWSMAKGTVSPYYANDTDGTGQNSWELG